MDGDTSLPDEVKAVGKPVEEKVAVIEGEVATPVLATSRGADAKIAIKKL